ncbi:MAG: ABC transporter permease subunit [Chloroflexi bacterium]|nr:ABC transporter permease subunit [Chloroflexota bacterium]
MTTENQSQPSAARPAINPLRGLRLTKSARRRIRLAITYLLLVIGAFLMAFPLIWMFLASFKPEWQILTNPPIWIPSQWIHVQAGDTTKEIALWKVDNPEGKEERVFTIGTRRYTTVVDINALADALIAVPPEDLSEAKAQDVGGVMLNVRSQKGGGKVVALARDGSNLVVAPVEAVVAVAQRMPLDMVNAGKRANVNIGDFKFQARELDAGIVVPLGPESQLTVVVPKTTGAEIFLVPPETLADPQFFPIGNTDLQLYTLTDHPADERFVQVGLETWQPVLDMDEALEYGYTLPTADLPGSPEMRTFELATLPVYRLTQDDGSTQDVILLTQTGPNSFVIPVDDAKTIRLSPLEKLSYPFVKTVNGVSLRYLKDYEEQGKKHSIAIVGERIDMTMVVPQAAISEAFDVKSDSLKRVLKIKFRYQNYTEALSRDVGGATFMTFYKNSALVVLLNLTGIYLSVIPVAYGFARLQAPGKNTMFLLLLSTMMIPFPVLLIPTYEIFKSLGMLNTLWPLFIRSFFGSAFFTFLLRQFFMSVPRELEEAARIDGANTLRVLWNVMLPLSKPALLTIGIFTFWWNWNSFFEPFVYVSNIKNFTVTVGLAFFKGQYVYNYHWLMAAGMTTIVPIIVLFFLAQRYFIEGIQLTGLKG